MIRYCKIKHCIIGFDRPKICVSGRTVGGGDHSAGGSDKTVTEKLCH